MNGQMEDLEVGCRLVVGDCCCQVSHALGMGSFGAVWAADGEDGNELAVKEIICNSHADLMNALYESHLLRTLGARAVQASAMKAGRWDAAQRCTDEAVASNSSGSFSPQASCAEMVPSLVASESVCIGPETWRVRLVMTRVHGEPVDMFLEQRRKLHESSMVCGGTGAVGWCELPPLSQQFEEASFLAREMLAQLAPGFEHISSLSLHRDVNSHNILIDEVNGALPAPRFGLVDFGLAVDAVGWCNEEGATRSVSRPSRVGQDGSSTWHYLDVGGDCRYWPLSAWVQFLAGWRELAACPSLSFEYQNQLDTHALGLTALQLLAELLPLPLETANAVRSADALEAALEIGGHVWEDAPPELLVLRIVWERYWGRVSPLHARLINTFHTGGDWDKLKVDCIKDGVHEKIAEDLRMLRAAIREVREACRRFTVKAESDAKAGISSITTVNLAMGSTLFDALLLLVSDGQSTESATGPEIWRAVRYALGPSANERETGISSQITVASMARPRRSTSGSIPRREIVPKRGPSRDSSRPRNRSNSKVREAMEHSKSNGSMPLVAPRSRRTSSATRRDEPMLVNGSLRAVRSTSQTERTVQEAASNHHSARREGSERPQPDHLSRRLYDLKSRVAWLSTEMAKLGEKSEVVGRRHAH
jgi:serine/threonine protein kinase